MLTKIVVITENKKRHKIHLLYGGVQSLLRTWPSGKHAVSYADRTTTLGSSLVTLNFMKNFPLGKVRVVWYEKLLRFQGHNKHGLEVLGGALLLQSVEVYEPSRAWQMCHPHTVRLQLLYWASLMLCEGSKAGISTRSQRISTRHTLITKKLWKANIRQFCAQFISASSGAGNKQVSFISI